jgi:2-keto-4-pentenoate hydratase/2-oxohepta-3-ene-1,7-dioic acid hydratase in catechol pathway
MKLASFDGPAGRRVGIVDGDEIVDLTAADPSLATMTDLLQRGPQAASGNSSSAPRLPLSSVKLAAPVPRPPKFLAIGYNNPQHLEETNTPRPTRQVWFNKQQSCIVGPGDGVWIPRIAPDEVDYEGELGMVIGRRCKYVPNDKAAVLDVIAGFTIVNDVSVRDWQALEPGMVVSKSFDTHGPIGPWIVTPDEIGYLSSAFTLEVGDVLSTGTPSGIAWRRPGMYLKPGDIVRVEIDKIGVLENPVIAEPSLGG